MTTVCEKGGTLLIAVGRGSNLEAPACCVKSCSAKEPRGFDTHVLEEIETLMTITGVVAPLYGATLLFFSRHARPDEVASPIIATWAATKSEEGTPCHPCSSIRQRGREKRDD
jgi:hypothetical protein